MGVLSNTYSPLPAMYVNAMYTKTEDWLYVLRMLIVSPSISRVGPLHGNLRYDLVRMNGGCSILSWFFLIVKAVGSNFFSSCCAHILPDQKRYSDGVQTRYPVDHVHFGASRPNMTRKQGTKTSSWHRFNIIVVQLIISKWIWALKWYIG